MLYQVCTGCIHSSLRRRKELCYSARNGDLANIIAIPAHFRMNFNCIRSHLVSVSLLYLLISIVIVSLFLKKALQINELVGLNFCGSNNTGLSNETAYRQTDVM